MSLLRSLTNSSARKNRERGSVLVVAMVALVALATLGGLTVVTVRSALSGTTHDQFKAVALAAAEAGVSVGIDYARRNLQPGLLWSELVVPDNVLPTDDSLLLPMPGNGVKPGQSGNIFTLGTNAWYRVEILNNVDDGPSFTQFGFTTYTGYRDGIDTDGRIIIRSTGHGPNNASVRLEVEIQTPTVFGAACNSNLSNNDGAGCGLVQNDTSAQTPL
jgi:hypothetical protein